MAASRATLAASRASAGCSRTRARRTRWALFRLELARLDLDLLARDLRVLLEQQQPHAAGRAEAPVVVADRPFPHLRAAPARERLRDTVKRSAPHRAQERRAVLEADDRLPAPHRVDGRADR